MRKQKYHLYLSDSERSFAIQNLGSVKDFSQNGLQALA